MSSYRDKAGVWAVYGYNEGPAVSSVHSDVVPAVREAEMYENVIFWPFDMSLVDAIAWWRKSEGPPGPTPEEWEQLNGLIRPYLAEELDDFGATPDFITGLAYRLTNKIFVDFLEGTAR